MGQSRAVTESKIALAEVEIRIDAAPETIFECFTDPAKVTQWMGDQAELDAKPGGPCRIRVRPEAIARGEFVRVEPPHFVSFTWGWEGEGQSVPPGSSLVEVTLTPDGDATVVSLKHSKLPSVEMVDAHTQGWRHYLSRLQTVATGGVPGPDPGHA